jgi:hypothetical protein
MPRLNWDQANQDNFEIQPPGRYHIVCASAEEGNSQRTGDPYIKIKLVTVAGGKFLADDYIMLAGPGVGMGLQKLQGFGIEEGQESFEAYELSGKKLWAEFVEEKYMSRPKDPDKQPEERVKLKVNIKAEGSEYCGYFREEPPGTIHPEGDPNEVPF